MKKHLLATLVLGICLIPVVILCTWGATIHDFRDLGTNTVKSTMDENGDFSGGAATADALSANGANCGAGEYAQGVSASGAAEGCSAPASSGVTETSSPTWSGQHYYTSDTGASVGEYLRVGSGGALEFVAASALPIDPKLLGIKVAQKSGVNNEKWGSNAGTTHYIQINAPPVYLKEGDASDVGETVAGHTNFYPVFSTVTVKWLSCFSGNDTITSHSAGDWLIYNVLKMSPKSTAVTPTGITCGTSLDLCDLTSGGFCSCTDLEHTAVFYPGEAIIISKKNNIESIYAQMGNGGCTVMLEF